MQSALLKELLRRALGGDFTRVDLSEVGCGSSPGRRVEGAFSEQQEGGGQLQPPSSNL